MTPLCFQLGQMATLCRKMRKENISSAIRHIMLTCPGISYASSLPSQPCHPTPLLLWHTLGKEKKREKTSLLPLSKRIFGSLSVGYIGFILFIFCATKEKRRRRTLVPAVVSQSPFAFTHSPSWFTSCSCNSTRQTEYFALQTVKDMAKQGEHAYV